MTHHPRRPVQLACARKSAPLTAPGQRSRCHTRPRHQTLLSCWPRITRRRGRLVAIFPCVQLASRLLDIVPLQPVLPTAPAAAPGAGLRADRGGRATGRPQGAGRGCGAEPARGSPQARVETIAARVPEATPATVPRRTRRTRPHPGPGSDARRRGAPRSSAHPPLSPTTATPAALPVSCPSSWSFSVRGSIPPRPGPFLDFTTGCYGSALTGRDRSGRREGAAGRERAMHHTVGRLGCCGARPATGTGCRSSNGSSATGRSSGSTTSSTSTRPRA